MFCSQITIRGCQRLSLRLVYHKSSLSVSVLVRQYFKQTPYRNSLYVVLFIAQVPTNQLTSWYETVCTGEDVHFNPYSKISLFNYCNWSGSFPKKIKIMSVVAQFYLIVSLKSLYDCDVCITACMSEIYWLSSDFRTSLQQWNWKDIYLDWRTEQKFAY